MTRTIQDWLTCDREPADIYDLLGQLRFDPDRERLLQAIRVAYSQLLLYQSHQDPDVVRRAIRLQRELGRADSILSDPAKLRAHQQQILVRLAAIFAELSGLPRNLWNRQVLESWLVNEHGVDPAQAADVSRAIVGPVEETGQLRSQQTLDVPPISEPDIYPLAGELPRSHETDASPLRVFGPHSVASLSAESSLTQELVASQDKDRSQQGTPIYAGSVGPRNPPPHAEHGFVVVLRGLPAPLRAADRLLLRIAGVENRLLHTFLRILIVVAMGLSVAWIAFGRLSRATTPDVVDRVKSQPDSVAHAMHISKQRPEPLHIEPIEPQTLAVGKVLTVRLSIGNPDYWRGKLRYSLVPGAPVGAFVDSQTGQFTWRPWPSQPAGDYPIAVLIQRQDGQPAQVDFTVKVTRPLRWGERLLTFDLGDGVELEMVLIPAGAFMMGDAKGNPSEKPVHRVNITKPFYLGKYKVVQEQWQAVMGDNPSLRKGLRRPVQEICWNDCQTFIQALNNKTGNRAGVFRLPTEAEWEYACRAGNTGDWCFGDDESRLADYAWYEVNSAGSRGWNLVWVGGGASQAVGQKRANAWGLYDMHGYLSEWCQDWYDGEYYVTSPKNDPLGSATGSYRVLRGGHNSNASGCRSGKRAYNSPDARSGWGMRLCLVQTEPGRKSAQPLHIQPIPSQTIAAGKPLTVVMLVEDAKWWEGKLQFRLGPNAPPGAGINPETGTFTWVPTEDQSPGNYDIAVSVESTDGQRATTDLSVSVVSSAPSQTTSPGSAAVKDNQLFRLGDWRLYKPSRDDLYLWYEDGRYAVEISGMSKGWWQWREKDSEFVVWNAGNASRQPFNSRPWETVRATGATIRPFQEFRIGNRSDPVRFVCDGKTLTIFLPEASGRLSISPTSPVVLFTTKSRRIVPFPNKAGVWTAPGEVPRPRAATMAPPEAPNNAGRERVPSPTGAPLNGDYYAIAIASNGRLLWSNVVQGTREEARAALAEELHQRKTRSHNLRHTSPMTTQMAKKSTYEDAQKQIEKWRTRLEKEKPSSRARGR